MLKTNKLCSIVLSVFIFSLFFTFIGQAHANVNLSVGSRGSEVAQFQQTLNNLGYWSGTVDGIFGQNTYNAVVKFQKDNQLKVDGIVGSQTRQALLNKSNQAINTNSSILRIGSQGHDVRELQQLLNSKGYSVGTVDGIFGSRTHNAVMNFQRDANITVDGIVGQQTRQALSKSNNSIQTSNKTLNMVATAYCPCDKCNFPWGGYPSYIGLPLGKGIIAVDPNVIPLGTRLYVEGYGYGIAADTGGAIKGNRIDLCFETHSEALRWGIQNVKVTILN